MNDRTRLDTIAPDLVNIADEMPPSKRLSVARKISKWACNKTGADSWMGEDEVRRMLNNGYKLTDHEKNDLMRKIEYLDEKYFAIVEENDGLDDNGEALRWFCKARAIATVLGVSDSEKIFGFCETLYEAQAATNDLKTIRIFVQI